MTPLTRRATAAFRNATPMQYRMGCDWYTEAYEVAKMQSNEHGVTIEVATGVLAALSPRLGWGPNVMLAERMLASGGTLDHGGLGRSLTQARAIYAGGDPDAVLGGPKTNAFYRAILTEGGSDVAVIDRHAWDMLVGKRKAKPPTPKQYREADRVMHRAAAIFNEPVHVVQATTWLVQRALFWNPGAFDLRERQPMLEGVSA